MHLLYLFIIGLILIPMSLAPSQVLNYLTGMFQSEAGIKFTEIIPVIILFFLCESGYVFLNILQNIFKEMYLEDITSKSSIRILRKALKTFPDFFKRNDPPKINRRIIGDVSTVEWFRFDSICKLP